jgi:hypothetical protein
MKKEKFFLKLLSRSKNLAKCQVGSVTNSNEQVQTYNQNNRMLNHNILDDFFNPHTQNGSFETHKKTMTSDLPLLMKNPLAAQNLVNKIADYLTPNLNRIDKKIKFNALRISYYVQYQRALKSMRRAIQFTVNDIHDLKYTKISPIPVKKRRRSFLTSRPLRTT